ncbi:MAG TPA: sulfite exporter TauE/SafE family protein [Gemmatimonadaceae bacterium]|nr:sulfite exporter TauE/SafE family protein [Gemmatimonadaceae bacterium]
MQFLLIGLAAGVLSGLFGIGGGIVIVPALVFVAQMAQKTATGTSLAALLLPVGALGAYEYYKTGSLDLRAALWMAPGLAIGALVGAKLALQLPSRELQRAFAVFLVIVAGRMWIAAK